MDKDHQPQARYCGCPSCRTRNARYARQRRRMIREGQPRVVPISTIRPHVKALRDRGMPCWAIAADAGVSLPTVNRVMYADENKHIIAGAAYAIRNVRYNTDRLSDQSRVDVTGTRRRVQALALAGWNLRELTSRLGIEHSTFQVLRPRTRFITVARARAVRALYEELWNQSPPERTEVERGIVLRTKRWARSKGFVPELAWDDIDDPTETLTESVHYRPHRVESAAATTEEVLVLKSCGMKTIRIAQRLGLSEQTIRDKINESKAAAA